jgi:hypothetical protein
MTQGRGPADVADVVAARAAARRAAAAAAVEKAGVPGALAHLTGGAAWAPDRDARDCSLCGAAFGLVTRRHHCRACGQVVCAQCSGARALLGGAKPERVCTRCVLGAGGGGGGGGGAEADAAAAPGSGQKARRLGSAPSAAQQSDTSTSASASASHPLSEEDKLLAAISVNVDRLGEIGRGMGAELRAQDRALDELAISVERAGIGLKSNTKQANKLAKS